MGIEGIGARVARKEDKRFITGAGRYVDDMVVPGMKHAAFVRSPHAHAQIKKIDVTKAKAMPGVIGVLTGKELKADGIGNLICGWMIHSKDGTPMKMGAWSPLAFDTSALCRRRGRHRGGRHQGPGARRRRGGRDHLQGTEGRHRRVEGDGQGRAANPSRGRQQSDLRLGSRRRRRDGGRLQEGSACRQDRHHQQPAGAERDGAARGARPLRQGRGPLHLLDDLAEPASGAAGDERLLQCRAGEQAARDRAGCRRRLRLEDLHLSRKSSSACGPRRRRACRSNGSPTAPKAS